MSDFTNVFFGRRSSRPAISFPTKTHRVRQIGQTQVRRELSWAHPALGSPTGVSGDVPRDLPLRAVPRH